MVTGINFYPYEAPSIQVGQADVEDEDEMTPEEKRILSSMASQLSEIFQRLPDMYARIIVHDTELKSLQSNDDRQDFRIGLLENQATHRPHVSPTSIPPKKPEDLGLRPGDTGSTWNTRDAQAIVRRFEEQEAMRIGAEQALERAKIEAERRSHETDRLLKRLGIVASAIVGLASAVTYLLTHYHP